MAITTVLFDLDGTLLPMDQDEFVKAYFGLLTKTLAAKGYDPDAFLKALWAGTKAMMTNPGEKTNEEHFWDVFGGLIGPNRQANEAAFLSFYENEFQQVRAACGCDPRAAQTIALVKSKGLRTALATNPLFPRIATQSRIRWAGLNIEDFELYTTYEDYSYCKPDPRYYEAVLEKLGVTAEECLMVGNDAEEDTAAGKLGMQVFLLTDCLLNRKGVDIEQYPHGGFDELMDYISNL